MDACSQIPLPTQAHPQDLDIDHMLYVAHKRFVEGIQTMELLKRAISEKEKEEIALVALMEVKDNLNLELRFLGQAGRSWTLNEVRHALLRRGLQVIRNHA